MTSPKELQARMLVTPFFSSFVGRARADGDLSDTDPSRRAAAWAHWAITSVSEMTGLSDRSYVALVLEGRFHDPKGTGPSVRPHLEIPARVLRDADPEFPDRLAQAGNGLRFPWWLYNEVTAVRRCLFSHAGTEVSELVDLLNERRGVLVDAVTALGRSAAPAWAKVEQMLVSPDETGLIDAATGDFSTADVADFFPAARDLGIWVTYDRRLREKSGAATPRRVGVWQIHGRDHAGQRLALGVVTPRLTANSQFSDPLFRPDRESPAALLVRGLLLRRLVETHLGSSGAATVVGDPSAAPRKGGPRLRAMPARVGAKLPEASLDAAVYFLQTYPDPAKAWEIVNDWSQRTGGLLTVTEDGYVAAHRNALRFLRRAENPERDDVNVVLPLAWLDSKVVRLTFAHPRGD